MAQHHLWKVVGLWKPTVSSLPYISRAFSSSHPVNNRTIDPVKERIRIEKYNEYCKEKRRTDPEWLLRRQEIQKRFDLKYLVSLTPEQWEARFQRGRELRQKKNAEDPRNRLVEWVKTVVRRYGWVRDRLPLKTHTPVFYEEQVRHTCSSCLVPKWGGAYKLWWASHDGEHYLCSSCYCKGTDIMPKGYEDVLTIRELRKRMKELGH